MTRSKHAYHSFLAEAIGTFALVFAGTGAVVIDGVTGGAVTHVGVALTFGLVVMARSRLFSPAESERSTSINA